VALKSDAAFLQQNLPIADMIKEAGGSVTNQIQASALTPNGCTATINNAGARLRPATSSRIPCSNRRSGLK